DVARLLAESSEQQLLRIVLGPADQIAPDRQAPGEDGTREYLPGRKAAHDDDRVENVDPEPPLLDEHVVSAAEARDRAIDEHRRRAGSPSASRLSAPQSGNNGPRRVDRAR